VTQLDLLSDESLMTATMLIFSYKGFLRSSECMALGEADVWLETLLINGVPTQVLFLFIEKSKTDQGRIGHTMFWAWITKIHGSAQCATSGRSAAAGEKARSFHNRQGKQLPPKNVNVRLKKLCTLAGLDPEAIHLMVSGRRCHGSGCERHPHASH
jgi:integrase